MAPGELWELLLSSCQYLAAYWQLVKRFRLSRPTCIAVPVSAQDLHHQRLWGIPTCCRKGAAWLCAHGRPVGKGVTA